jgi:hypothetical protein
MIGVWEVDFQRDNLGKADNPDRMVCIFQSLRE